MSSIFGSSTFGKPGSGSGGFGFGSNNANNNNNNNNTNTTGAGAGAGTGAQPATTNTTSGGGGGIFGNFGTSAQNQNATTPVFGGTGTTGTGTGATTNTTGRGGGIFGSFGSSTTPVFGSTGAGANTGTSGTATSTPSTTGGLGGGGGLFGNFGAASQNKTSTPIFGAASSNVSNNATGTTGNGTGTVSLFGNKDNANQGTSTSTSTPTFGGGLFGNTTAGSGTSTTGGSLFGAGSSNTAGAGTGTGATGGSLFNTTGSGTGTGTGTFGGSLFGKSGNLGGGLFGNNANTNTNATNTTNTTNTNTTQPATNTAANATSRGGTPVGSALFGTANTANAGIGTGTGGMNTGGGLFGNTSTGTGTATGGGLFGNTNANTTSNANANATTTTPSNPIFGSGLFGSGGQQQQQRGNNIGTTTGGTSTASATSGTGTGTNTTGTISLFGKPATPSLFGQTAQPAEQQQPTTTTSTTTNTTPSLFGQPSQTASTTTPSLFGQSTQPAQNTQQQPTTSTPSLFGQASKPEQQQSQPTTSLFGQPTQQQTQPSTTTSLFGQTAQQKPQTSFFGNFGSSTTNSNNATANNTNTSTNNTTTGLFGNTLGTSSQPSTNTTVNGTTNANANTTMGFNLQAPSSSTATTSTSAAPSNLFGSRTVAGTVQTPQHDENSIAQYQNLMNRIDALTRAWDAGSPFCKFQHYFYNLVDPSQVHLYGRPANATNDILWQKAVRENPDPKCYVPALAVGFDDLQKRVEAQKQQSKAHLEKIKELHSRIRALSESHTLTNAPRLQRVTIIQSQLNQRIVRLAQHLHLLIPALRSSSIRPEEEALRTTLEELEMEIRRPGGGVNGNGSGSGRQKGKLNELWALIGVVLAAKERDMENGIGVDGGKVEWAVVDPEGLQRIAQILREEQNGIAHLTKIIQDQMKDLDIIYGIPRTNEDNDPFNTTQARQILLGASVRIYKHRRLGGVGNCTWAMSNLDSFISHTKQPPLLIATSQQIRDRGSLFTAYIFQVNTTSEANAAVNHVTNVLHASNRATHEMSAWRCMMLKKGRSGLNGEDDFELVEGYEDDGEEFGGKRVLRTMVEEGAMDAVVVVSRWYGGTMLGPARFKHIEMCTREVCRSFRIYEEIQSAIAALTKMDAEIVRLRAQLATLSSPASSEPDGTDDGQKISGKVLKSQDYSKLLDPPDLPKAKRLITARQNALKVVRAHINNARQKQIRKQTKR